MAPQSPAAVASTLLDFTDRIESALRERHNLDGVHGLATVIRESIARDDSTVQFYAEPLSALAEIHDVVASASGTPAAPPLPETIAIAERIWREIIQPTPAIRLASSAITRAASSDSLSSILQEMRERAFSQIPVYDRGLFAGLLTTNAVARWLSQAFETDGSLVIEEAFVRDVLPHLESHEVPRFIPKATPATAATAMLLEPRPPLMLILTESGRDVDPPLGVLVAADLPELLETLNG